MKYVRLVSDLHLDNDVSGYRKTRSFNTTSLADVEFHERLKVEGEMGMLWFPIPMEGDDETTLVVAGDIWTERRFLTRKFNDGESWAKKLSKMFKYVVVVLGNHDFWGQNLIYEAASVRQEIKDQGLTNFFFLEKSVEVLDQVKFVGGTLWTDLNRNDPRVETQGAWLMNDYKYIRTGSAYRKSRASDMYEVHMNTKKFIFANVHRDDPEQKVIVVTHMAPSYRSISPNHRTGQDAMMNFFYYSDLEERLRAEGQEIDHWFHGHMHTRVSYDLAPSLTVHCNPRGYGFSERTGFDPLYRIEL